MEGKYTFMNEGNLQILILNPSHIVRVGLANLIQRRFKNTEIFLAESYFSLLRTLNRKEINVLICEALDSFEKTAGFALRMKKIQPDMKLLILSNRKVSSEFTHTTYKSIDGFLDYSSNENDFYNALAFLREDKSYVKTGTTLRYSQEAVSSSYFSYKVNDLSSRELEVAQMYIVGDGNLEISQRLNLSPSTVSTYKKRIFDKLGVDNIMSLARLFETRF